MSDVFPEPDCEICGDMGGNGEPCPQCKRVGQFREVKPLGDEEPF